MSLAVSPVGYRPDAAGLLRRHWPLLPLAGTVLLLLAPIAAGDASTSGKVGPADAASLLLVFVCAVQALRGRVRELSPLGVLVLGVPAVGLAVATATAGDPYVALPGFVRYLQVFVLVPAAIVLLVRDAGEFRLAAGCFVVLALVQGAVGVVQFATHTGASYQGQDVRAVGTFGPGDVMGMATVVAYGLVVATAVALAPGLPQRVRRIAGGVALVLVLPLVLSFSRGVWIATMRRGGAGDAAGRDPAGPEGAARAGRGRCGAGGRARGRLRDGRGAADLDHPGLQRPRPVGDRPLHDVGRRRVDVARAAGRRGGPQGLPGQPGRALLAGALLRQ